MSILFIASGLLGVFVIAACGLLIFAPAETLQFYGQKPRIRMLAALQGVVGIAMFWSAKGMSPLPVAYYVGIVVVIGMTLAVIAPGFVIAVFAGVMDMAGTAVLRGGGVIGVIGGVIWIYYCFAYLY